MKTRDFLLPIVKAILIRYNSKMATKKAVTKKTSNKNNLVIKTKRIGLKRRQIIFALIVLLFSAFLYFFKGLFIVATVNGQPISRLAVVSELEKQGGKQTLDSMITQMLILQEAKNKNVTVSQKEIDEEVKKIEESLSKQGQNLDSALALQGMSRKALELQIKIQKVVDKLLGKDISVTDKEVDEYIEKNKELLPQDQKPEELKAQINQQLKQQKLQQKFQSFITDLKSKAKINYFIQY